MHHAGSTNAQGFWQGSTWYSQLCALTTYPYVLPKYLLLHIMCRAAVRPSVSAPRAPARCVVVKSGDKDNIYHDRETTKSRKSNP